MVRCNIPSFAGPVGLLQGTGYGQSGKGRFFNYSLISCWRGQGDLHSSEKSTRSVPSFLIGTAKNNYLAETNFWFRFEPVPRHYNDQRLFISIMSEI